MTRVVLSTVLLILVVMAAVFKFVWWPRISAKGTLQPTNLEFASQLRAALDDPQDGDWEFLHIPIHDQDLELIRRDCWEILMGSQAVEPNILEELTEPTPIHASVVRTLRAYVTRLEQGDKRLIEKS